MERERKKRVCGDVCLWRKERDMRHNIYINKLKLIGNLVLFSFSLTFKLSL